MKRLFISALALSAAASLFAQSAGGGISVFVPESLYRYQEGTIAFEQGLSTSVGFGSVVSVPIGFAYHSTDGYLLEHDDAADLKAPAFYGDSIIPYIELKAHIPLGSTLYLEAFGGGALNWAFSMKPTGDFAQALAEKGGQRIAVDSVSIQKRLGYGWVAGGAIGAKFGKISVDLGATYRYLITPITVEADISRVDGASAVSDTVELEDAKAILRGISIQLGGNFKFK
jgi:hypothetical protein